MAIAPAMGQHLEDNSSGRPPRIAKMPPTAHLLMQYGNRKPRQEDAKALSLCPVTLSGRSSSLDWYALLITSPIHEEMWLWWILRTERFQWKKRRIHFPTDFSCIIQLEI